MPEPTTADVEQSGLMAADLPIDLRVCPHLRQATQGPAVRRVRTPVGDDAWLVSGYKEVRDLLRDERLGRSHTDPEQRGQYAGHPKFDQLLESDHERSDAAHNVLRTLMKPHFATRRMQVMRLRVEQYAADQVGVLLAKEPPAELRANFSEPLIHRVLCDLYGTPDSEVDECMDLMSNGAADGFMGLAAYLGRLVASKRSCPDDSFVSRLCEAKLSDEQCLEVLMITQFAGGGATIKQIDHGVMLLTGQPGQWAALAADFALVPGAVEELLRLAGSLSLPRYAREDIEIDGVTIRDGELVLVDLTRANYDEAGFADPASLDVTRSPNRHLTFSHGVWTCLGAPLARMLLCVVFETLLTRTPNLRAAGPVENTIGPLSGGFDRLTVTW